jgi:hypothetical protein
MRGASVLAALLLAGASAAPAGASVVTYEFAGVVSELLVDQGLFGPPGSVQLGDGFTGRFAYEIGAANPDQAPGDPTVGQYELLEFVVDQSAPPLVTTLFAALVTHDPGLPTLPPLPPDPGTDRLSIVAMANVYPTVTLALGGPFGSVFLDDSLPVELDLADFADGGLVRGRVAIGIGGNPDLQDLGTITSLTRVPEPGTASRAAAAAMALLVALLGGPGDDIVSHPSRAERSSTGRGCWPAFDCTGMNARRRRARVHANLAPFVLHPSSGAA